MDTSPLSPPTATPADMGPLSALPATPATAPDGRLPLRKLTRRALRRHLARLRESLPVARAGLDPEGVHVLRTAVRRLATTLETLEDAPTFDRKRLRRLRRRLDRLARILGRVRDLDVLRGHLQQFAAGQSLAVCELEPLCAELRRRHARARHALLDELNRRRTRRLLRALDHLAAHPCPRTLLARHIAGSAIWRRYEAVLAFETSLPNASPATLHDLRTACKRLRYTLELFAGALGPGTASVLASVIAAQDHLGALHDHIFALALLEPLREAHPDNASLAAYAAARAQARDELRDGFAPLWASLSGQPFRQTLAALIAAL